MASKRLAIFASFAAICVALACVLTVSYSRSSKSAILVSEYYGKGSLTKEMFSGRCRYLLCEMSVLCGVVLHVYLAKYSGD